MTLLAVTKSQEETNKLFNQAQEYAKTTPFGVEEIVRATVQMKALGVDIDKTRNMAVNLASAFSTDLMTAVQALSRATKGSSEGYEVLRNQYGITSDMLEQFGGKTQNGTSIILKNRDAIEQNKQALEKLITTKYGDAVSLQVDTAKTAFSNFEDGITRLKGSIGEQLLPEITNLTLKINESIEGFNNMSKEQKGSIANLLKFSFVVSGVGFVLAGLVGVGANVVQVYNVLSIAHAKKLAEIASLNAMWGGNVVAMGKAKTSMLGLTMATWTFYASMVAILVLGYKYNEMLKEQIKTEEIRQNMLQQDSKAIQAYYEYKKTGLIDLADKEKVVAMIQGSQLRNDQEALKLIRERIRLGEKKVMTDIEVKDIVIKSMEEETKRYERLRDLDRLSLQDKKNLLLQYNELVLIKQKEGAEEDVLHDLRQKAYSLELEIQKAYEEFSKKYIDFIEKKKQKNIEWLEHQKNIGRASEVDEIAFYERMLKRHELTEQNKLEISRKIEVLKYQLKQKEIQIEKEKTEKIKQENEKILKQAQDIVKKRGELLGRFQENYIKLTKGELDLDIIRFNREIEEYRKSGFDKTKIHEMIEAKKLEITERYAQKQKDANKDVRDDEIARLKSMIGQLESERGQSPFMSAEEMSARNRLTMLGADFEKSPQASPPISSDVMAQVNKIGESPTNINNTNANTSNDRVYNINIAGISLSGDKAKGLGSMLANLVPLDAVNRAESTIISMA
jgi:hypothetical protein